MKKLLESVRTINYTVRAIRETEQMEIPLVMEKIYQKQRQYINDEYKAFYSKEINRLELTKKLLDKLPHIESDIHKYKINLQKSKCEEIKVH